MCEEGACGAGVLFDTEGLLAEPVLVEHVIGLIQYENLDVRRVDDLRGRQPKETR